MKYLLLVVVLGLSGCGSSGSIQSTAAAFQAVSPEVTTSLQGSTLLIVGRVD